MAKPVIHPPIEDWLEDVGDDEEELEPGIAELILGDHGDDRGSPEPSWGFDDPYAID